MTCLFLPPFLKVNFVAQTPNIISQNKPYLDPRIEAIQGSNYLSRTYSDSHNFFNILDDNTSFKTIKESSSPFQKEQGFEISLPTYTKGIYLTNSTGSSIKKIRNFITQAKQYGLNTFVIDVQKKMIAREIIDMLKEANIFPIARIVVFKGGLKKRDISQTHLQRILNLIADSAAQGFKEIQLDYIRYADLPSLSNIPLQFKYNVIEKVLKRAHEETLKHSVYLSADLFGRTTLHEYDQIGQRLELFAKYTQTIYPMLYPSHYTNDIKRIANPYNTVSEGITKAKARLKNTRIVAYIQGFSMKVASSGLSMSKYIEHQIKACKDALADGWVIWNPKNQYLKSFQAISDLADLTPQKKGNQAAP